MPTHMTYTTSRRTSIFLSLTPPSSKILADASSIAYDRLYTTSRTPHWTILTEHVKHGHLQGAIKVSQNEA